MTGEEVSPGLTCPRSTFVLARGHGDLPVCRSATLITASNQICQTFRGRGVGGRMGMKRPALRRIDLFIFSPLFLLVRVWFLNSTLPSFWSCCFILFKTCRLFSSIFFNSTSFGLSNSKKWKMQKTYNNLKPNTVKKKLYLSTKKNKSRKWKNLS